MNVNSWEIQPDANLQGAHFDQRDLQGANLQGANLHCRYTNFSGANLDETEFEGADLNKAIFGDAKN